MKKRMIVIVTVLVLGSGLSALRAQSIADLTEQLALDIQKLGQLKSILSDMKTGYEVLQKGYTEIRDIAKGNYNLHELFLDGLWLVSPAVRSDARIGEILDAGTAITLAYQGGWRNLLTGGHFTGTEQEYIAGVYASVFHRSGESLDELNMILTDGQLRMSDAERLGAIARIHEELTGQQSFVRSFTNSLSVQAAQRAREAGGIGMMQGMYGIGH